MNIEKFMVVQRRNSVQNRIAAQYVVSDEMFFIHRFLDRINKGFEEAHGRRIESGAVHHSIQLSSMIKLFNYVSSITIERIR